MCSQLDALAARSEKVFNRFVQLSLATVAGFFWLQTQDHTCTTAKYLPLVHWIVPVLAAITIIEIVVLVHSWWGYRVTEAKIVGYPDIYPKLPKSGLLEVVRCLFSAVVGIAAYFVLQ